MSAQLECPSNDFGSQTKIITFDCYGTLVDWYEVLTREATIILDAHDASDVSAESIVERFSIHSKRLTADKPHRMFKNILRIGFDDAFGEWGIAANRDELDRMATAPANMEPHRDVPEALRLLKTRYKLAIFTNSDDDLIKPTVERIGVTFDYVITAEQARSYKPSREIFEYGYRQMGVTPEETVHVAMGMYTDMKACHELGLRAIWVNRRGENGNPDWRPYTEVRDLRGATDLLMA
ncbi:haloacid dehalogenase type II [Rhizobiales bacterium RZME27]|uniref:Haloacid dehalogenase type II n=1 Tax=Endobacterium cereale TaxID=2663029 RepID=A0A6A8ABF9_9HYPH|nr:haloacid dehalogenase type II [Endobacterium cereale]MEB2846756.1 haloacid dehalogenase type II [Endobacterium cereale]MQY46526.1 haloacid dehalogenase type II [Endobacterium cereale]